MSGVLRLQPRREGIKACFDVQGPENQALTSDNEGYVTQRGVNGRRALERAYLAAHSGDAPVESRYLRNPAGGHVGLEQVDQDVGERSLNLRLGRVEEV